MKKMIVVLLAVIALNLFAGCEVIQEIVPGTSVAIDNKDASFIAHWLDNKLNDDDDDDD